MIPTLIGRIQTRVFVLATVGLAWTLLIASSLPRPAFVDDGAVLEGAIQSLVAVLVIGIAWEFAYHAAQQYRWEKDWPTIFSLLVGIPEGIVVYALVSDTVPGDTFFWHFTTTWIVVWGFTNTFMQVIFPRWRYNGGRLV